MATIAPTCSASTLLTLSLPALSQIPFRGQGEGIGARYARLVKFTEKNAFGCALRRSLREQAAEIPKAQRRQGACAEGSITRWPVNNRDRIKLFILKMIKSKNGLKHLIFASV
jgi:hypothetical protein